MQLVIQKEPFDEPVGRCVSEVSVSEAVSKRDEQNTHSGRSCTGCISLLPQRTRRNPHTLSAFSITARDGSHTSQSSPTRQRIATSSLPGCSPCTEKNPESS